MELEPIYIREFDLPRKCAFLMIFKGVSYIRVIVRYRSIGSPSYDFPLCKNDIDNLFNNISTSNMDTHEIVIANKKHPMVLTMRFIAKENRFLFGIKHPHQPTKSRLSLPLSVDDYVEFKQILISNMSVQIPIDDLELTQCRHCNRCNTLMDIDNFYSIRKGEPTKDRWTSLCIVCHNKYNSEYGKKWRANNPSNRYERRKYVDRIREWSRRRKDRRKKAKPKKTVYTAEQRLTYKLAKKRRRNGLDEPDLCYVCDSEEGPTMYHIEYGLPELKFVWLCSSCFARLVVNRLEPWFCLYPKELNRASIPGLLLDADGNHLVPLKKEKKK